MNHDVVIIGSGLAGLTCALLLARHGRSVLVLEQHTQPAPVVRGFRRGGFAFDSGFHYVGGLGEGGAFQPLFKHLGLDKKVQLLDYDAAGFDRLKIRSTGELLSLPIGYNALRETLGERFPNFRSELDYYFDTVENSWSRYPYLDPDLDLSDFAPASVHGTSLSDQLQVFAAAPELQGLLSMHSFLYGVTPDEASTTLNAQVAGSYYHSVHGIAGGGRSLIDGYLELLQDAGVTIRCRAQVEQVTVAAGKVSGVQLTDGDVIPAKEVIATLNPTLLPQMLPDGVLRPAYLKRLNGLRQTMSASILFGKSSQSPPDLKGSNLFIQNRPGIFSSGAKGPIEQRSCYVTATEETPDGVGIVAIVPTSYRDVEEFSSGPWERSDAYPSKKDKITEAIVQLLSKSDVGLSGVEPLELSTPLTLRDYSLAPQGGIYGVGHFIGQYNPHPVTRLPGLYLSGQAIAAPGLLGAVVASYLTCGTILGHEVLRGEIRSCH